MYLLLFVLLFAGCGYEKLELTLPKLPGECKAHIQIVEKPQTRIGYIIYNKFHKEPITLSFSPGLYIKNALCTSKKIANNSLVIKIDTMKIVYFPDKPKENMYAKIVLDITVRTKNSLRIKHVDVTRIFFVEPSHYEKKIAYYMQKLLDEATKIIRRSM